MTGETLEQFYMRKLPELRRNRCRAFATGAKGKCAGDNEEEPP